MLSSLWKKHTVNSIYVCMCLLSCHLNRDDDVCQSGCSNRMLFYHLNAVFYSPKYSVEVYVAVVVLEYCVSVRVVFP